MAKKQKTLPNVIAQFYDPSTKTLTYEGIIQYLGDKIETESGVHKISDADRYYDQTESITHFIFNVDLPAQVEASNLKQLRRSTALNNIFNYDIKKPFDIVSLMPWLIIVLLILFM